MPSHLLVCKFLQMSVNCSANFIMSASNLPHNIMTYTNLLPKKNLLCMWFILCIGTLSLLIFPLPFFSVLHFYVASSCCRQWKVASIEDSNPATHIQEKKLC